MVAYNIGTAIMATLAFSLAVQAAALPEAKASIEKRQCVGGGHAECIPLVTTQCQLRCTSRNAILYTICMDQCVVKAGEQCINDC
ncbi:unnamed protein product [Penicillium salamii]|uniref:Uncharacterized protein n=1 Tax=Penicillium salamii TaxID=1612424 RepID=A0A9W4J6M5_9EURO|nr:unnamed protein product [Penicillium salamii]CAG8095143.1 unnamed protein product [Penicillium salamii]CAG8096281.1 unnamed protein product [Penicillium salamii]CAG8140682.1 unnamed protein product [Penicillium salamii]CAG8192003.1 unnamed protein product [Penicillium salamii]